MAPMIRTPQQPQHCCHVVDLYRYVVTMLAQIWQFRHRDFVSWQRHRLFAGRRTTPWPQRRPLCLCQSHGPMTLAFRTKRWCEALLPSVKRLDHLRANPTFQARLWKYMDMSGNIYSTIVFLSST